jgi:uncharacterized repeat protein (TIGR01451 family)
MKPVQPIPAASRQPRSPILETLILAAALGFGLTVLHAAPPAARTNIGNQAKATYTDNSNVVREVYSNTVVTQVASVYGLTLVQANSLQATPGSQVFFSHTVTNNGNDNDTIALSTGSLAGAFNMTGVAIYPDADANGLPDNYTAITSTGVLAAGASFHFVVAAIVPPAQTSGQVATLTVTAQSAGNTALTGSNVDTVTVTNNAVMSVVKSSDKASGIPGTTPVTYTLTYTNTGNTAATAFTITDVIPTGMTYVTNSARWSVTGSSVVLTDTDKTDNQSGIIYDFGVTATGKATFVVANVAPGQSGYVTFQVSVNAGIPPQVINNSANFVFTSGGTTTATPFTTNVVPFTVTQVAGVTFVGPAAIPTADAGSTVAYTNTLTNTGTGTDTFDIVFTPANTFPVGTTFQLFQSDGATPMVDSNGNGIPDTGPVAPGGVYLVVVKATLPGTAGAGGPFNLYKTATSTFNPGVSAVATDILTVIAGATVDLTNNAALGSGGVLGTGLQSGNSNGSAIVTNPANPGTTTIFTLYVNNTSSNPDTYNLVASQTGTFGSVSTLPTGWTVTFKKAGTVVSNTGTIAPAASTAITAEIFVPAGATPIAQPIYFQSSSPITGATDSIRDAVSVNTIRSITIQTSNVGQTYPGGSVVYEHILTNNGNVTEGNGSASTITFTLGDTLAAAGFTSVVYYDINGNAVLDSGDPVVVSTLSATGVKPAGLAPGESARIFVKVYAPLGAADSAVDATTVTVTTSGVISTVAAPSVVANTDATSVVRGNLVILKEQAIDLTSTGTGVTTFTTSQLTAAPGAVIVYRITVTNNGSSDATAITVNDSTPSNTTYFGVGSQGIANVGGDTTKATAPTNGGTGPFVFTIGTLASTKSSVITFAVKINQ